MSGETEKAKWEDDFEMAPEYDFSNAIPNPHGQRFQELNLVSLDPDVKDAFLDSRSVKEALRLLIQPAKNAQDLSQGTESLAMAS